MGKSLLLSLMFERMSMKKDRHSDPDSVTYVGKLGTCSNLSGLPRMIALFDIMKKVNQDSLM